MNTTIDTTDKSPLGITITRRGFVKIGGTLFVAALLPPGCKACTPENQTSTDPTQLASWLEIRSDNSIVMRTGRAETDIVDQDDQHIGRALGWPQFPDRRVLGVGVFGIVGRQTNMRRVRDGKMGAVNGVV